MILPVNYEKLHLNYQLKKLVGEIIEQTFAEKVRLLIKIPE